MEGQNKRTEIEIECMECGDVFSVSPTYFDTVDLDSVVCPECWESQGV